MAKFNLDNYLPADGLGFPLNFRRGNPNPLDNSSVWKTLDAAKNYAETDPTAYVGQILSVIEVDDENAITAVMAYIIEDEAGTLKEVGSVPTGDDLSIEVVDGVIQIKGFGKQYYKYIAATDEQEAYYELTEGFIDGLEPKIVEVDGKLTIGWYEPNPTTVEGLNTEITTVKENITTIETTITEVQETIVEVQGQVDDNKAAIEAAQKAADDAQGAADAAQDKADANGEEINTLKERVQGLEDNPYDDTEVRGLISDNADAIDAIEADYLKAADKEALQTQVTANKDAIDVLNGDETVEGSVAKEVADAINAFATAVTEDGTINTYKEIFNYIATHGTEAAAMTAAIDALELLVGEKSVATQIAEAIAAENLGQYATDEELAEAIARIVVLEEFDTTVDGKIATAVENLQTEVNTALDNKVDKAEGYSLISDEDVVKLAGIADGAEVNFIKSTSDEFEVTEGNLALKTVSQDKVTGLTNAAGNDITLLEALGGKVDKVEGSRLLTSDEAAKLEKLVMDESGNVGISGTISADNVIGLQDKLDGKVDKVEGMGLSANNLTDTLLEKLNGITAGAQVNAIDGVSSEFTISADGKVLSVNAIDLTKITGLTDALAGKVDAVEGKGLSTNDLTDELLDKLNAADTNVLEVVKLAGTALVVEDKAVNIPVATASEFGVVKSTDAENGVTVAEDGTMAVNKMNVNNLVQTEGDILILNGGNSSV